MTDFIRRLVSGPKARFQDDELGLDLDLVYVTDRIIIMGYPAVGLEGLYRNRREDAKKFLDHRHSKNYWVYNFCPIRENSYDAAVFEGRVTRFPFPDHHAPPLALLPLVAREMHDWLDKSPDHVAVLHCKAGKGRSGTMACTYLLTLDSAPNGPSLDANHSATDRAARKAQQTINELPEDDDLTSPVSPVIPHRSKPSPPLNRGKVLSESDDIIDDVSTSPPPFESPLSAHANPERSFTDSLKGVLDLHTARRMKPAQERESTDGQKKKKQQQRRGVSIPSQQRWLYYWALLLAGDAPKEIFYRSLPLHTPPSFQQRLDKPKVRITRIQVRLKESSGMARKLVHATNVVLDKAGHPNELWASIARYDDALIDILEKWEAWTREEGPAEIGLHRRRKESKTMVLGEIKHELDELFDHRGVWDEGKMVRSFAKFGLRGTKDQSVTPDETTGGKGNVHTYSLRLINDKRWRNLEEREMKSTEATPPSKPPTPSNDEREIKDLQKKMEGLDIPISEANSMFEEPDNSAPANRGHTAEELEGLVVDASRELRVKLYVGRVFIGWFWFIPSFHMPQPPPTSTSATTQNADKSTLSTTFHLNRKDLDFALGLGSSIIDVDVDMEWVVPGTNLEGGIGGQLDASLPVQAGDRADSVEDRGIVASALQAATQGGQGVRDALRVGQASGV
ncbi:hypothetical protein FA15DRAFT_646688 [Coprinopsis marcescibilis]|uniref:phosphatidylinositol-3,4,5-trisphosphate 3-phosphatase n=1 Tax=Coprinopsis marcescibilis TaxID=230819 RepID=A0A5C3KKF6_COPMA|nr:hypothetical protein FA15DRAFT_646688 [Coprinopsis marcescibilis]